MGLSTSLGCSVPEVVGASMYSRRLFAFGLGIGEKPAVLMEARKLIQSVIAQWNAIHQSKDEHNKCLELTDTVDGEWGVTVWIKSMDGKVVIKDNYLGQY